jgi:ActR/RegA family two-component response regulator
MFGILREQRYGVYVVENDKAVIRDIRRLLRRPDISLGLLGHCADAKKAVHEIRKARPDMVIYDWKLGRLWLMNMVRAEGLDCAFILLMDFPSGVDARDFVARGGFDCWPKPLDERDVIRSLDDFTNKRSRGEDLIPMRAEYPPSRPGLALYRGGKER